MTFITLTQTNAAEDVKVYINVADVSFVTVDPRGETVVFLKGHYAQDKASQRYLKVKESYSTVVEMIDLAD